ncbi:ribokinase [Micromonospora sp. ATA32]|nr:ribokinase [Micromonospora sp. ATA32]
MSDRAGVRAVVVGSLNADLVTEVPRIPRVGHTLQATAVRRSAGGKGANQAVALARLGATVDMVGAVGNDADGRRMLDELAEAGVSTLHVAVDADEPTGLALVMVDADGDNAIVVVPGANVSVDQALVSAGGGAIDGCEVLLAQLEIPLPAVEAALRSGAACGALVVLNAAPARPLPDELLALVDVLVVNEHEARELSGRTDVEAAAVQLCGRGAAQVVVTLGADGALMLSGDERVTAAGFPVRPVDTTGAGDCFVAALTVALAARRPPADALRFANAAAAVAVTRQGTQSAMPSRDEVEAFLASHPVA